MLHYQTISKIAERKNSKGEPVRFSIVYVVTSSGELRSLEDCICTSSHFRPASINIQRPDGQIRKVRCCTVLEFNGVEIYI